MPRPKGTAPAQGPAAAASASAFAPPPNPATLSAVVVSGAQPVPPSSASPAPPAPPTTATTSVAVPSVTSVTSVVSSLATGQPSVSPAAVGHPHVAHGSETAAAPPNPSTGPGSHSAPMATGAAASTSAASAASPSPFASPGTVAMANPPTANQAPAANPPPGHPAGLAIALPLAGGQFGVVASAPPVPVPFVVGANPHPQLQPIFFVPQPPAVNPNPALHAVEPPHTNDAWDVPFMQSDYPSPTVHPEDMLQALAPDNDGLGNFLKRWAWARGSSAAFARASDRQAAARIKYFPSLAATRAEVSKAVRKVDQKDMETKQVDMQGIRWGPSGLGVSRSIARACRESLYTNYTNVPGLNLGPLNRACTSLIEGPEYFSFRRMDMTRRVRLSHFQLRNIIACASRNRCFFAGSGVVHEFNPVTHRTIPGMTFTADLAYRFDISTLAAGHGVLIAGGLQGEYCMRRIDGDTLDPESRQDRKLTDATVINTAAWGVGGITNHVDVFRTRSGALCATFASNDRGVRVVDLTTQKLLSYNSYGCAINCTAMSPDGRMRVLVGDTFDVIVTSADDSSSVSHRNRVELLLEGHRDFGFACAWSENGHHVATGFQDRTTRIWDARAWHPGRNNARGVDRQALALLPANMSGPRSLRFSPLGCGPPVLVAAEEADFISVIDATSFGHVQEFDLFGELGGLAFADGGRDMYALCTDKLRGGILQFERNQLTSGLGRDLVTRNMFTVPNSTHSDRYRSSDAFGITPVPERYLRPPTFSSGPVPPRCASGRLPRPTSPADHLLDRREPYWTQTEKRAFMKERRQRRRMAAMHDSVLPFTPHS